jgi:adenine-specific DNA methylase
MATINQSILEAALSEGKITGNLSEAQKVYFHPSVVTANQILAIIK